MTNESTFTPPNQHCPHPERWHAHDEDATETEVTELVAAMVRATRPDFVLETGTYLGHTSLAIRDVLHDQGYGHLVTIELDVALWFRAHTTLQGCCDTVTVVEGRSLDYVPDHPIDFAWFDSAIDIRAEEFRHFRNWMHSHTVVGFHDTAPHHPVRKQLATLVAEGIMTEPLHLNTPRGVSFAKPLFM